MREDVREFMEWLLAQQEHMNDCVILDAQGRVKELLGLDGDEHRPARQAIYEKHPSGSIWPGYVAQKPRVE